MANPQLLQKEEEHTRSPQLRCEYPIWALKWLHMNSSHSHSIIQVKTTATKTINNICMVVPYTKGLSKSFRNICCKVGFQVHFKRGNPIRNVLVAPRTGTTSHRKGGVIYSYSCDKWDCDEGYLGESSWIFGERLREHLKAPSAIYDHAYPTGYHISWKLLQWWVGRHTTSQAPSRGYVHQGQLSIPQ